MSPRSQFCELWRNFDLDEVYRTTTRLSPSKPDVQCCRARAIFHPRSWSQSSRTRTQRVGLCQHLIPQVGSSQSNPALNELPVLSHRINAFQTILLGDRILRVKGDGSRPSTRANMVLSQKRRHQETAGLRDACIAVFSHKLNDLYHMRPAFLPFQVLGGSS